MSSMAYNSAAGLGGMLKAGSQHFSQEDDAGYAGSVVLRNIEACLQLSRMLSTSLGPQGRCKLVVNHLGKLSVTSDCASILKDVEVEHPAAQLLQAACQKQEEECGDNTNFVLAFAGELLWQTASLIGKMTWQPAPEILAGYKRALQLIETEYLPRQVIRVDTAEQKKGPTVVSQRDQLLAVLQPVLASKQYGSEGTLAPLVADACLSVMPDNGGKFNVEAVRTVKIPGASVSQSCLVPGYVAKSPLMTVTQSATDCKIAVYACGMEASSTEAKGTVLMKNADDLLNYNATEERKMQEIIQGIADSGVRVVVTGGNVSDMALHFLDRYQMACLRVGSKWELRRLCQAVRATALVRLGPPTPDEMGHCDTVQQREMGGRICTVFTSNHSAADQKKLATIVLRASTSTVLNDLERAVDDGVQAVAQFGRDPRLVHGGGAVEMAWSLALQEQASKTASLEQYALTAFAKALEIIPRTLAENAGHDAVRVLADLNAAHAAFKQDTGGAVVCDVGVDIELGGAGIGSMKEKKVVDLVATKLSALRLAVDAVIIILKIDQIIMSKKAGGPQM